MRKNHQISLSPDSPSPPAKRKWIMKYKGLIILIALVLFIQSIAWILIITILPKWTERGSFGDMFGAVNTLFSGLAFASIVYAIFLQRADLKVQSDVLAQQKKDYEIQKEDLELNRKELKKSADAQRKQAELLQRSARITGLRAHSRISSHFSRCDCVVPL